MCSNDTNTLLGADHNYFLSYIGIQKWHVKLYNFFTYKIPFLKGCISLANGYIYQIFGVWIAG